jgi:putative two-component system response regulator
MDNMEGGRKKIILVDDVLVNLKTGSEVLGAEYDVFTVPSAEKLFKILKCIHPDMILLDIDMPGMDGYQALRLLKAEDRTRDIPVIFLSAHQDPLYESQGLSLGAVDYLAKPYSPQLLRKRVETQFRLESQGRIILEYGEKFRRMEAEKDRALGELKRNVLKTVIGLVERRDEVTGGHVERTHLYVEMLLDALVANNIYADTIQSWERDFFLQSTRLYDLGKVSINDRILLKPGKLTDDEFTEMKKHTLWGVKILEDIEAGLKESSGETGLLEHAKAFAGFHHEWWDGSGYPYGLKGANIPLQGRIMAVVDVYSALVAERPYKKACTHEEAARIIAQGKGTHFDPALVDIFLAASGGFQRSPGTENSIQSVRQPTGTLNKSNI